MKGRRGQGITEYVIVVGLIAIGLVGAVKALGFMLERSYGTVTGAVEDLGLDIELGGGGGGSSPAARRALKLRGCSHPAAVVDVDRGYCGDCGRYL